MTTYRQALKRESDGRYDFTSSTGSSGAYALGYCAGWKEPPGPEEAAKLDARLGDGFAARITADIEKKRPFQAKYHKEGHADAAEACECYRQYELDHELKFKTKPKEESDQLHRCQAIGGCAEFTAGIAFLGQYNHFYLCDSHRNRDEVEKLINKKDSP